MLHITGKKQITKRVVGASNLHPSTPKCLLKPTHQLIRLESGGTIVFETITRDFEEI